MLVTWNLLLSTSLFNKGNARGKAFVHFTPFQSVLETS